MAYQAYSISNQVINISLSLNNINQYNIVSPHYLSSLINKLHLFHYLESVIIHATLLILHKSHTSSYAYNSSNSYQSYKSQKLLLNQLNKYDSSFQKYRQGNHHQIKSPSVQVSPRITNTIMYTSPHNSHNHNIHQISRMQKFTKSHSIMTRLTKHSNACNVLDSSLDACGTIRIPEIILPLMNPPT